MSIFRTRRASETEPVADRAPAVVEEHDDPAFASIEGVTLDRFVSFIARVSSAEVSALKVGETQPFSVAGQGAGIKFWRYKVK